MAKAVLTVYEFDRITEERSGGAGISVPPPVFHWLQQQAQHNSKQDGPTWIKHTWSRGHPVVAVRNYVGVLRAPDGFQIEILPKTERGSGPETGRRTLLRMLASLPGMRHLRAARADLRTIRMPLMEIFIGEFLNAVQTVVKHGLRSDYLAQRDNLPVLRGRLLVAQHLRSNLVRRDRFYTEHDVFCPDRPINRVLKAALLEVLRVTRDPTHNLLARELVFVFADIPLPACIDTDLRFVCLDRGMEHYGPAIDWAKLFLRGLNPIGASGIADAPTLLFPMEKVFEYYVAAQLHKQLARGARLQAQAAGRNLVEHLGSKWFRLRPDAVISVDGVPQVVLDTKWKLINCHQNNAREKYGLREQDFYQLFAYGENYLPDGGSLVLVYPKTPDFTAPLPPFRFQSGSQITLWVVPFQLDPPLLILPADALESERIWSRTGCLSPGSAAQTNMCDVPRRGALFA